MPFGLPDFFKGRTLSELVTVSASSLCSAAEKKQFSFRLWPSGCSDVPKSTPTHPAIVSTGYAYIVPRINQLHP